MSDHEAGEGRFDHLRRQATGRADRTVARVRAGIAALQAAGRRITADSLKEITRELEPGFAGLSFQVIRRNPRAYTLYRESADALAVRGADAKRRRGRHASAKPAKGVARSSYDPLQRLGKRELARRVRALEQELEAERRRRATLAFDQQVVLGKMLQIEAELLLLQAQQSNSNE